MMFSIQPKRFAAAFMALLVTASVFIVSCQKELSADGFTIKETPPDITTKIASSVSGFVTDETETAVQGATVQVGSSTTTTDKYGYFEVSNAQVVKNAAVVTVIKPGYFSGIKTYIAEEGHKGFFRIKILPKTNQGNFDAATGGTVTLANGLSIAFPANAVKLASGGTYTGQVNVAAQWLNPTANDIIRTMPGDLRGLDSLGFMRVLTSYGMSATELTGAGGELLQIANGKKATINFPIPAAINSAPSNIPLWHFNETNGLWIQEGIAVKSGANYVGEVSHFSWWNCDLPNSSVPLTFNVVNTAGDPVAGVYVDIVPTSNSSWSHAGGYLGSDGHVAILVTPNTQYKLSIHGECGSWENPAYTQDFSVGSSAVDLGTITLTGPSIAEVSGTVECGGTPLADAYVVMKKGNFTYRYPVNADGTYRFTTTVCGGGVATVFVAENLSTLQAGDPLSVDLVAGSNTIPALGACVNDITQFVNYSVNGVDHSINYPVDSIYYSINNALPPVINIYAYSNSQDYINFSFDNEAMAAGTSHLLRNFMTSSIPDSTNGFTGTPLVNITEYGNVGEYVAGNFTCIVNGVPTPYNVTCQFRVRRR